MDPIFNWILALVALLVAPAAPGGAPPEIDVLTREGYRHTVVVLARETGLVRFARVEGRERRPMGTLRPADPEQPGASVAFSSAAGAGTLDMAPFDAVASRLAGLTAERPPVEFVVEDHPIFVVRRADVVYATDRATGETFVVRLPPPTAAPPPEPLYEEAR